MLMTDHCVPLSTVPHSSSLLIDYIYHFQQIQEFFNGSPYDPKSYQAVASQMRSVAFNRVGICDVLAQQNQSFGAPDPTLANIERLRQPGTFAVVTGQQVG